MKVAKKFCYFCQIFKLSVDRVAGHLPKNTNVGYRSSRLGNFVLIPKAGNQRFESVRREREPKSWRLVTRSCRNSMSASISPSPPASICAAMRPISQAQPDGYLVLDAEVGYEIVDGVELYFQGRNITDNRYASFGLYGAIRPAAAPSRNSPIHVSSFRPNPRLLGWGESVLPSEIRRLPSSIVSTSAEREVVISPAGANDNYRPTPVIKGSELTFRFGSFCDGALRGRGLSSAASRRRRRREE